MLFRKEVYNHKMLKQNDYTVTQAELNQIQLSFQSQPATMAQGNRFSQALNIEIKLEFQHNPTQQNKIQHAL